MGKHFVIKALNKLYKRGIILEDQEVLQEQDPDTDAEAPQDTVSTEPASDEASANAPSSDKNLDFTQSNIDKA